MAAWRVLSHSHNTRQIESAWIHIAVRNPIVLRACILRRDSAWPRTGVLNRSLIGSDEQRVLYINKGRTDSRDGL